MRQRIDSFKNHIESLFDQKSSNYVCEKDNLQALFRSALFSSPGLCFSPGWRCPEARFVVFQIGFQAMLGEYFSRKTYLLDFRSDDDSI